MLFGRDTRKRLEPVRIVRGTVFDGPRFHRMRNRVRHIEIERFAIFDGLVELLIYVGRKILLSHVVGKNQGAETLSKLGHTGLLASRPLARPPLLFVTLPPYGRCVSLAVTRKFRSLKLTGRRFADGKGAGCAALAQSFSIPRTRGIGHKQEEAGFRRPRIRC